jgi:hypothetical protein
MNPSSGAKALTRPSQFRSWYQPTAFAQDRLDPTGYKLSGFYQDYLPSTRTNSAAPPHTVSSSLEASRPRSVVELTEVAKQSLGSHVLSNENWLFMAESARIDAEDFYEKGKLESAFIEFTRASTIVHDKLPAPDYRAPLSSTARHIYFGPVSYSHTLDPHLLPLPCGWSSA